MQINQFYRHFKSTNSASGDDVSAQYEYIFKYAEEKDKSLLLRVLLIGIIFMFYFLLLLLISSLRVVILILLLF